MPGGQEGKVFRGLTPQYGNLRLRDRTGFFPDPASLRKYR
jgi:hypothetical protein